jgi:hypothetical protein
MDIKLGDEVRVFVGNLDYWFRITRIVGEKLYSDRIEIPISMIEEKR